MCPILQKTIIIISMKIIMKNACIVSDSCGLLKNENNSEVWFSNNSILLTKIFFILADPETGDQN